MFLILPLLQESFSRHLSLSQPLPTVPPPFFLIFEPSWQWGPFLQTAAQAFSSNRAGQPHTSPTLLMGFKSGPNYWGLPFKRCPMKPDKWCLEFSARDCTWVICDACITTSTFPLAFSGLCQPMLFWLSYQIFFFLAFILRPSWLFRTPWGVFL